MAFDASRASELLVVDEDHGAGVRSREHRGCRDRGSRPVSIKIEE